ncbi:unnamed protein product [Prorocentrum cordatum]|uniref:Uncharacterized protein n=1 Tax=Prorocentrum cordatum TaxID=2364126 RepID=A0ABN9TVM6_9DINO|nr:unnamed protein product [Polarella glacialis]
MAARRCKVCPKFSCGGWASADRGASRCIKCGTKLADTMSKAPDPSAAAVILQSLDVLNLCRSMTDVDAGAGGALVTLQAAARAITNRQTMEEAFRRSRHLPQALQEHQQLVMWRRRQRKYNQSLLAALEGSSAPWGSRVGNTVSVLASNGSCKGAVKQMIEAALAPVFDFNNGPIHLMDSEFAQPAGNASLWKSLQRRPTLAPSTGETDVAQICKYARDLALPVDSMRLAFRLFRDQYRRMARI